jgi:eukaryotic-like serine/threonine-protein kinase
MASEPSTWPVAVDGRVFVGSCDGNLTCLDPADGNRIWTIKTGGWVSPVLPHEGRLFFGDYDKRLYCVDMGTGDPVWSFKTKGRIHSRPDISDDEVRFGSEGDRIYCLRASDGEVLATRRLPGVTIWSTRKTGRNFYVTALPPGGGGMLYCLEPSCLETGWKFQSGGALALPVAAHGRVWVSDEWGTLTCLQEGDGRTLWTARKSRGYLALSDVFSDILCTGGQDGKLHCLEASTGRELWLFSTLGEISQPPVIRDNRIFFCSCDKRAYCLDQSGEELWHFETQDEITFSPCVVGNRVYVAGLDRTLRCLEAIDN